jgi:hypothetical protein
MKSTETQAEYLEMLSFWFENLTGKTLEEVASEHEVTLDYFIAEFI